MCYILEYLTKHRLSLTEITLSDASKLASTYFTLFYKSVHVSPSTTSLIGYHLSVFGLLHLIHIS